MTCLTRYLYEWSHVNRSLIWALLDRRRDEALFWTYEGYFSGFQEETWAFLEEIYRVFYADASPELSEPLELLYLEHQTTPHDDTLVGTFVVNLLHARYSLGEGGEGSAKNIRINVPEGRSWVDEEEVDIYRTTEPSLPPRKWLTHMCRYSVRTVMPWLPGTVPVDKSSPLTSPSPVNYSLYRHWLYHASGSPVWAQRISEYGGTVDDDAETVVFDDDDDLEDFYTAYDLDPDEQPLSVQLRFMPPLVCTPMSWEDFEGTYGSVAVAGVRSGSGITTEGGDSGVTEERD